MEYKVRETPLFSACGLNCGLCPRYQTDGASKCPGCAGEGFMTKHPSCGLLSCSQRREIEYCFLCEEYPCKKYDGADESDSFITHLPQLRDMEKAKNVGIESYKNELDEKVGILENLLENYNDGRRKNFFCIAVNLLPLQDIRYVLERLTDGLQPESTPKEKAALAVSLFKETADRRNISLKLRKKA